MTNPTPTTVRRFANAFRQHLLRWSTGDHDIAYRIRLDPARRIAVLLFTLDGRDDYSLLESAGSVTLAINAALEAAPDCRPLEGDWSVFSGARLLVFRRYDEPWDAEAAWRMAAEVWAYIQKNRNRDGRNQRRS